MCDFSSALVLTRTITFFSIREWREKWGRREDSFILRWVPRSAIKIEHSDFLKSIACRITRVLRQQTKNLIGRIEQAAAVHF